LFVALYVIYWFLYRPISKRLYFSKFPQTWINPQFHFLFGDYSNIKQEYEVKGKFLGNWFKDQPLKKLSPYMLF